MRTRLFHCIPLYLLFICTGITAYGIYRLEPSFSPDGILHYLRAYSIAYYASFICAFFIATFCLSKIFRLHPYASGCLIGVLVAILTNMIWPLSCVIAYFTSSYICGQKFLAVLKIPRKSFPAIIILLSGTALYGTIASLLFHFPINYGGLYILLLSMPILLEWRQIKRWGESAFQQIHSPSMEFWLDAFIVAMALLFLALNLMPDLGVDAYAFHLFLPDYIKTHQQWHFDSYSYFTSCWPILANATFAIGYLISGEVGSKLLNFGFFLSVPMVLVALAAWMSPGLDKTMKKMIWIAVFSLPLSLFNAGVLMQDVVWMAYSLTGVFIILNVVSPGKNSIVLQRAGMMLGGFFAGAMLATKMQSFAVLASLFIILLLCIQRWFAWKFFRSVLGGLSLCILIGAVPYCISWIQTGNPVYPFFPQLFGTPSAVFADLRWHQPLHWDTLYQMTFSPGKYVEGRFGVSGFFWIIFFLPVAIDCFLRRNFRRISVVCTISGTIAFTFLFIMPYIRYIEIANVLLISCAAAWIGDCYFGIKRKNVLFLALCMTIALNFVCYRTFGAVPDVNWTTLVDKGNARFETRMSRSTQRMISIVNSLNTANFRVFFVLPLMGFYGLTADSFDSRFLQEIAKRNGYDFKSSDGWRDFFRDYNIGFVMSSRRWPNSTAAMIGAITEVLLTIGDIELRVPLRNRELASDTTLLGSRSWLAQVNMPFSRTPFSKIDGDVVIGRDGITMAIHPLASGIKHGRYKLTVSVLRGDPTLPSTGVARVVGFSVKTGNWLYLGDCRLECKAEESAFTTDISIPEDVKNVEIQLVPAEPTHQVIFKSVSFLGI